MMAENAVVAKCFGQTLSPGIGSDGVITSCLLARSTMFGEWLQFAGPYENLVTKLALKKREILQYGWKKNMSHPLDEIEWCKNRRYQRESI